MPERVRLQRRKGWRMPPNTVKVDRTTKWGNPFALNEPYPRDDPRFDYIAIVAADQGINLNGLASVSLMTRQQTVEAHMAWFIEQPALMLAVEEELRGLNLACWCPADDACHADNLLFMANPLPEGFEHG